MKLNSKFLKIKFSICVFISAFLLSSCTTVPITGRSRLSLVPDNQMNSLSQSQYTEFLEENKLSSDQKKIDQLNRVGNKIKVAVEKYFEQNYLSEEIAGYDWQFNLIEDDSANAWCMPGGRVVVYTGILPYTKDENGLAVVLGHEIAHAVARHGQERMTQALLLELGDAVLSTALKDKPQETIDIYRKSFAIGSKYGIVLPYSRVHEREADRLGLIFMAMAGYDPKQAVDFWTRMSDSDKKKEVPEFLSTHPSDENRIEYIKSQISEAMLYYDNPVSLY